VSSVGVEEALSRGVPGGVVGVVVVPEAPDDLAPRASEDPGGVGVASVGVTAFNGDVARTDHDGQVPTGRAAFDRRRFDDEREAVDGAPSEV
jgi:hypothetical protein